MTMFLSPKRDLIADIPESLVTLNKSLHLVPIRSPLTKAMVQPTTEVQPESPNNTPPNLTACATFYTHALMRTLTPRSKGVFKLVLRTGS